MPERVYIETTFVSYLTARPSRDVVIAGHQQITHEWWDTQRGNYELCVSQLVLQEAGWRPPGRSRAAWGVAADDVLGDDRCGVGPGERTDSGGSVAEEAADDALHIAIAATQGVSYLLTWNCRHLANATMRPLIEAVCVRNGIKAPIICTPEELLETKP